MRKFLLGLMGLGVCLFMGVSILYLGNKKQRSYRYYVDVACAKTYIELARSAGDYLGCSNAFRDAIDYCVEYEIGDRPFRSVLYPYIKGSAKEFHCL